MAHQHALLFVILIAWLAGTAAQERALSERNYEESYQLKVWIDCFNVSDGKTLDGRYCIHGFCPIRESTGCFLELDLCILLLPTDESLNVCPGYPNNAPLKTGQIGGSSSSNIECLHDGQYGEFPNPKSLFPYSREDILKGFIIKCSAGTKSKCYHFQRGPIDDFKIIITPDEMRQAFGKKICNLFTHDRGNNLGKTSLSYCYEVISLDISNTTTTASNGSSSTSSASSTTSTTGATTGSTSTTTPAQPGTKSTGKDPLTTHPTPSKYPVGYIVIFVLGALGALAVLFVVVFAVVSLCFRKRRQNVGAEDQDPLLNETSVAPRGSVEQTSRIGPYARALHQSREFVCEKLDSDIIRTRLRAPRGGVPEIMGPPQADRVFNHFLHPTRTDRNSALIDILIEQKTEDQICVFIDILNETQQAHIAQEILRNLAPGAASETS